MAAPKPGAGGVNGAGALHPLHSHYQPRAKVRLVENPASAIVPPGERAAYCGLQGSDQPDGFALHATYDTQDDYAAAFYEFLREADRCGVSTVYVQRATEGGVGHALRDRQRRAAGQ